MTAPQLDPRRASVRDVLERAARRDPLGHGFHLAFALGWAFFFPFEMMPGAKDILMGALAVTCVLRIVIRGLIWAWAPLTRGPLLWFMLLWCAWTLASAAWSPMPEWGLDEGKAMRAMIMPLLVFPVLGRPGRLLVAFLAGVATINILQVSQAVGLDLMTPKVSGRYAAWCSPNPLGLIISVAIVMHVALLITRRSRGQAAACLLGLVVAILGLAFCLNRGGVITVLVALPLIFVTTYLLRPQSRQVCLAVMTALTVGVAAAWWVDDAFLDSRGSNAMMKRWDHVVQELRGDGTYADRPLHKRSSSARLVAWAAMRDVAMAHPIIGTGAGGLAASLTQYPGLGPRQDDGELDDTTATPYHPHSTWLWVLAATGGVGLLFMVLTLGSGLLSLIGAVATSPLALPYLGGLIVWCVGNVLDTLLISGSTAALLAFLLLGAIAMRVEDQTT